jgi:hypothetical protein
MEEEGQDVFEFRIRCQALAAQRDAALAEIVELNVRFAVANRTNKKLEAKLNARDIQSGDN